MLLEVGQCKQILTGREGGEGGVICGSHNILLLIFYTAVCSMQKFIVTFTYDWWFATQQQINFIFAQIQFFQV